ncbi:transposase [Methyloglobulus morosus KoM1]|uniref:Transposase n=2 Tax=Methyloglobulus TaxID=1410680 RepID=V5DMW8_9GAMM|nr:transposase [Methyloglobulus morosus KoM1]
MQPKRQETETQYDLFKTALADLLNPRHELVLLAGNIDWQALDTAFGEFFTDGKGAPALPTRLVAGLHYLKHAFGHSDEEVVALWVENPLLAAPVRRALLPAPSALPPDLADQVAQPDRRGRLRMAIVDGHPSGRGHPNHQSQ